MMTLLRSYPRPLKINKDLKISFLLNCALISNLKRLLKAQNTLNYQKLQQHQKASVTHLQIQSKNHHYTSRRSVCIEVTITKQTDERLEDRTAQKRRYIRLLLCKKYFDKYRMTHAVRGDFYNKGKRVLFEVTPHPV